MTSIASPTAGWCSIARRTGSTTSARRGRAGAAGHIHRTQRQDRIPLVPPDFAPPHNAKLNPVFDVDGERVSLVTQLATSIRTAELHRRVGSLASERDQIIAAIDVLIGTA